MTDVAPVYLEPLPDRYVDTAKTPDQVADDLLWIIRDAIDNHPRSLQKTIGPSEVGGPCARQIGYKLLGTNRINQAETNWRAAVGTAVHAMLETVFDRYNLMFADSTCGQERFLVEHKVNVGQIGGVDIWGSDDIYDRATYTVVDWKTTTPEKIRAYKANGPGPKYRAQAHLYGRGLIAQGYRVDHVMLVFLLRNGALRDTHIWHEPYSEQVALDALARANAIQAVVTAAGVAGVGLLPAEEHFCTTCLFFKAGSVDPAAGCPGVNTTRPATPALTLTQP